MSGMTYDPRQEPQPGYGSQPQPGYGQPQTPPSSSAPSQPGYGSQGPPAYGLQGPPAYGSQEQPAYPTAPMPQYQAYPGEANNLVGGDPTLAEWWRRLLGYLVDAVVLVVIYVILRALISPKGIGGTYLLSVILVVITFIYCAVQHAQWGQTLGKRALGTMVVTADSRSKITGGTAATRAAVYALPPIVPLLGGLFTLLNVLWLTWDPQRQALHDKAAKTVVVKVSSMRGTGS